MNYPITTTLNRIWACNPCDEGKQRALEAAGKNAPDDEPITFQQIVEAVGLEDALWCCRVEPQHNQKWRLFAVWCARQVQHLVGDQRSLDALDVAERYANDQATGQELAAAGVAAGVATRDARAPAKAVAWAVAWAVAGVAAGDARDAARAAGVAARVAGVAAGVATRDAQRAAFIQLVTAGSLPELPQEVAS